MPFPRVWCCLRSFPSFSPFREVGGERILDWGALRSVIWHDVAGCAPSQDRLWLWLLVPYVTGFLKERLGAQFCPRSGAVLLPPPRQDRGSCSNIAFTDLMDKGGTCCFLPVGTDY